MFENTTVFYLPFLLDDYKKAVAHFSRNPLWTRREREDLSTNYLLNYAGDIQRDAKRFSSFRYTDVASIPLYLYESDFENGNSPRLLDVRASFFSTKIGFLELSVGYGNMSLDDIVSFASRFKSATKPKDDELPDGRMRLYDWACSMLPDNAIAFFAGNARFKYDCHTFHMIKAPRNISEGDLTTYLHLLRRNYDRRFADGESDMGSFDMEYKPYFYDFWAGSQEGFVNIVTEVDDEGTNYFINNYKYLQLNGDYRFLYLMLLNQRYTAIHYIKQIAEADMHAQKEIDEHSEQIVALKTQFSFRVISNDKIYQNIYTRLYDILDIDELLKDLQDNEAQLAVLQNASAARSDKMTSKFLFGLSLLSIFSALVDAAGYFEKIKFLNGFAVSLSLFCTGVIVALCILWILFGKNK